MFTYEHKNLRDLNMVEYNACHYLNNGAGGAMQERLFRSRMFEGEDAVAILARTEDGIVGWALIFHNDEGDNAYFYVADGQRRKGIGTQLMAEVKKVSEKPKVYPWDGQSKAFFANFQGQYQH